MPDLPAAPPAGGTCPLCGGDNACGLAAGAATCWCFDQRMPAAVLAQVPDSERDRSCICQTCATAGVAPPAPPIGGPHEP